MHKGEEYKPYKGGHARLLPASRRQHPLPSLRRPRLSCQPGRLRLIASLRSTRSPQPAATSLPGLPAGAPPASPPDAAAAADAADAGARDLETLKTFITEAATELTTETS
jgi:hypothetical protein